MLEYELGFWGFGDVVHRQINNQEVKSCPLQLAVQTHDVNNAASASLPHPFCHLRALFTHDSRTAEDLQHHAALHHPQQRTPAVGCHFHSRACDTSGSTQAPAPSPCSRVSRVSSHSASTQRKYECIADITRKAGGTA